MQPPDDSRVDDLRKQLRALGYLDAGVDRFVLSPATSARRPSVIAILASLRVGLLAAALLGPAAAIGIRTRLPGLVTGAQDAMVVALYLGVLFGVAAMVFSFVASMLVARFAGTEDTPRARFVSRIAGTVVAVGCLTYLTLWWRSANAELIWTSPGWTSLALMVAVVVSLLLGHAVSITTFAVAAARHPLAAAVEPSRSSRRLVLAAGVFAFAAAAGLLVLAAPRDAIPSEPPRLAVVSPGVRVRVIAIDGFDPAVFDSLRAAGRVPTLARVFSGTQARLDASDTRDPARVWTTIATGQPPDVHGVRSLETRRVAGMGGSVASGEERGVGRAVRGATDLLRLTRPSIASGDELRAKTFWDVAAEAGLRVVVVNWWATWPAGSSGSTAPVILSDRATLRLERGGALDAEIAPKEIYDKLRADWPVIKERAASAATTLAPSSTDPSIAAALRRSAELDALQVLLLNAVGNDDADLVAVYLPGLDIAQHTLLGAGDSVPPSMLAARLDAVRAYYGYLDSTIGSLLSGLDNELVFFVTQPGRVASRSAGTFAAAGRLSSAAESAISARSTDIAPTVLHALGVPVSRELPGRPLTGLFSESFVNKFPVRDVSTYGPRRVSGSIREGQPLDDEMIERLRSLGYVR
jgi:hypothetical protein